MNMGMSLRGSPQLGPSFTLPYSLLMSFRVLSNERTILTDLIKIKSCYSPLNSRESGAPTMQYSIMATSPRPSRTPNPTPHEDECATATLSGTALFKGIQAIDSHYPMHTPGGNINAHTRERFRSARTRGSGRSTQRFSLLR